MAQRPDIFTLNASHTLANGLVFAGLGAHAGSTRYHDSSVFGNHGTLTGIGPLLPFTRFSNGLIANGSGRVDLPNTDILMSTDFTWSMWMYTSRTSNSSTQWVGAYRFNEGAYAGGFYIKIPAFDAPNDVLRLVINHSGTDISYNSNATFYSMSKWKHIAITKAGTDIRFFVDGNLDVSRVASSAAIQIGTVNSTAILAKRGGGAGETWSYSTNLQLMDTLLNNRALTLPEIQQLADPSNVMLSGLINPPRRKWWPVVSGAAPTFKAAWATKRRQTIGGGVI